MNENNEHIEDEELKKSAPFLFGMEKKNDFQVPDGYFDRLPSEIQDKIIEMENKSVKSKIMQFFNWKVAVPAVSFVVILFAGIYYMSNNNGSGDGDTAGKKDSTEVKDTLHNDYILPQDQLAAMYFEKYIEEMNEISEEEYIDDIMDSETSILVDELVAFDIETEEIEMDDLFAFTDPIETGENPEIENTEEETFSSSEIGDYFFDSDLGLGDIVGEL